MKKIVIELELHKDTDDSRAEDVVDNYLDGGALQDEVNGEVLVANDPDSDDHAVVNASCYVENTDAMDAMGMLDALRKHWRVLIFAHADDGQAVVELSEKTDPDTMVARYVEPDLARAITRAWAGEPADG